MTQVASVYAQALYDLARDERISAEILEQMNMLRGIFAQNPDYVKLLDTPNLPKEERCRLLDEGFFGRVQIYVLNFLKILTEKGYIRYFDECCEAYREMYNEEHGILTVQVVTAVPLTEVQRAKLCAKLTKITGKKIELSASVDASCIGGVRLDYDGKRVEDTVRRRLDAVHSLLRNTML